MQSVGIVVAPAFCYTKGKLVLGETKTITLLPKGHHKFVYSVSVFFKGKQGARDERP